MANINDALTDDEDFMGLVNAILHPRMQRQFRKRPDHFEIWRKTEFLQRFRLSKEVVRHIVEVIPLQTKSKRNHALTPENMVLLSLRFLATGSFLQVAGDFIGVDKSTASRVVNTITRAIASLNKTYINMPNQHDNIVKQSFYNISRFPRCIGVIDCTHIQSPGGVEPENFRNRKRLVSFNVQAVCDDDLQISNIVCRWPGSAHDANIFRNSRLRRNFERREFGESLLLGDSGYGIKPYYCY